MIRWLTGQLPLWAQSDHPMLRQELGSTERLRWQTRYTRALLVVLLGGLLLLMGVFVAAVSGRFEGQNIVDQINAVLYYPLLIAQIPLRVIAFTWTSGTVADYVRRGKWDQIRTTPKGAELVLRVRWISLFYRWRGLFSVITVLRLLLIALILFDLTSFQGRYLDLLTVRITPEIPAAVTILFLSFLMTASLLLPFTGTGFDASLGLVVSAVTRGRTATTMIQAVYTVVRIGLIVLLLVLANTFLSGQMPDIGFGGWVILFALGALGDWGLAFLHLARYGEIWAIAPYGIFLGAALLIYALIQAGLADAIVGYAIRLAQKRG